MISDRTAARVMGENYRSGAAFSTGGGRILPLPAGASGSYHHIGYEMTPVDPSTRHLQVYAIDPSVDTSLETAAISRCVLPVRWEKLEPGPVGEYLEVLDIDPSSACAYDPVDLDRGAILAGDGLPPSERNPQFHQQMALQAAEVRGPSRPSSFRKRPGNRFRKRCNSLPPGVTTFGAKRNNADFLRMAAMRSSSATCDSASISPRSASRRNNAAAPPRAGRGDRTRAWGPNLCHAGVAGGKQTALHQTHVKPSM